MLRAVGGRAGSRRARVTLVVVASLAVGLAVLAGCGAIGEKYVTIEWSANYFEKYYTRWMDDFAKDHADENVRVAFRSAPSNGVQKVYTMLISHTLSDVVGVSVAASLLLSQPVLEPVMDDQIDRDDFVPLSLRLCSRADGTLVAWPTGADMRGFVYYNMDYIKQAGLVGAPVPEDFAGYREWASKTFEWQVGDATVVGMPPAAELDNARMLRRPIGMTRGFVWSCFSFVLAYMDPLPDADAKSDGSLDDYLGGPPSNRPFRFDTPEFAHGLAEYRDFFLPKKTAIADGDTSRMNGFTRGIYSGMEGGNWIYGEIPTIDLYVTKFPHAEGRPMRTWGGAGGNGVSVESRHKALAIEWARYISAADRQVDAYYGHGYLPARLSAWKRLSDDAGVDKEIRARFLTGYTGDNPDYVGVPLVKRQYHDRMDVTLFVPLSADRTILTVAPDASVLRAAEAPVAPSQGAAEEQPQPAAVENVDEFAAKYEGVARKVQQEVAALSAQEVTVIVQGTPPEMIPSRSFVTESPVPIYAPVLAGSCVYIPPSLLWDRIGGEVITRALQFVSREDNPMSPEDAAKWAQAEAQDIAQGRK